MAALRVAANLMLRLKALSIVPIACAFLAYFGVLVLGQQAKTQVVDAVVYGASLTADGRDAVNTNLRERDGSAAIGLDYHFASSARWTISPLQRNRSQTRWLYLMADDPQFFSSAGDARVYVENSLVGDIRSAPIASSNGFAADRHQQPILIPPGRTFGYRFPLGNPASCAIRPCTVSVRGSWMFWHVYRIAIVGERARFVANATR